MIDILSSKFTNDFCGVGSNNLVGGLAGRVYADIEFFVHWETINKDLTFNNDTITRNDGGNFIIDGFRVGQTIYVEYTGTSSDPNNSGEYVIVNISAGVLTVDEITASTSDPSYPNGTLPFITESNTIEFNVHGTSKVQNMNFYFGLVENASAPAFISLLDGETQKYSKNNLDTDASNTYSLDIASSNKSWVTGTATDITDSTITELGTGYTGVSTGFEQAFKIHLVFNISPAYLDTLEDTNGELAGNLFPELAGANSLKFVSRFEAGTDNSSVIFSSDNGNITAFTNNGDVGFYDQYRNTLNTPEYSVTAIEFTDPNGNVVSQMIKNAITTVEISLYSATGKFVNSNTRVITTVYEVPEDFADVKNNANTLYTNFNVSYVNVMEGSAPTDNNNIDDLVVTFIDANNMTVAFNYLPPSLDNKYLIVIETADSTEVNMVDSDGMTLLASFGSFAYNIDLSEIYSSDGIIVNEHSSNDVSRSSTDYKGWIEDGVLFTNNFTLQKQGGYTDELTISLRSIDLKIEAVNSADASRNFTLEQFNLLPPNEDEGRTFQLPTGDPKNYLSLEEIASTVNDVDYTVKYATKLRWETWLTQANADPDFLAATKDWSEYQTGNWSVKMNMYLNIRGVETDGDSFTFTIAHGTNVGVKTYEDYDGCEITGIIETFHEPTMTDLSGVLSKTANTFVRATFYGRKLFPCVWNPSSDCEYTQILSGSGSASDSNGEISDLGCPELYGILELDDLQTGGINFIRQISSLFDPETDTPWIGESGVRAKLTHYPYATNPCSILEAVLDVAQLDLTRNYKLSARIGEVAGTICMVAITYYANGEDFSSYSNNDLIGHLEDELLIFGNGLNQDSYDNILTFIPPTIVFKTAIGGLKICCASAGRIDDTKAGASYINASLIGLDECDFLFFTRNGTEATTQAGYTFNSGLGEMAYAGNNGAIIIDFKEAFICETVAGITSYTDAQLQGLTMADILVFATGLEGSSLGLVTLVGDTLNFGITITGKLKVCRVNQ